MTATGQDLGPGLGDDDLPVGARARLLRVGYLRVHGKGLFAGSRFAAGDDVARVTPDAVHLSVTKKGLLH